MSALHIPAHLRRQVIERARERCEYCRMPDRLSFYPPEIDHIIARKHGGKTDPITSPEFVGAATTIKVLTWPRSTP